MIKKHAIEIIEILQQGGKKALFVGGCVRDMLIGYPPKDFDIVTNALPEEIEEIFPDNFPVGKQFGIINILYKSNIYEIATFRKDGLYNDNRRPSNIELADIVEDAQRRDLTINGIYYDPIINVLYDYAFGLEDIKNKIIRFIGNPRKRIKEDYLRLLRVVRFGVKLKDFTIDSETWEAVKKYSNKIKNVSAERIREEMSKILSYGNYRRALELLYDSGLLKYIIPELIKLIGCKQSHIFHPEGDVWEHTIKSLENSPWNSQEVLWAILLHDIGKPTTKKKIGNRLTFHGHAKEGSKIAENILKRLRFPNNFIEYVTNMIKDHMKIQNCESMKKSTLKKFLAKDYIKDLIVVKIADSLGSNGDLKWKDYITLKLLEWEPEEIKPDPLVTGKDLIKLGYKPGPIFSIILNEINDLRLEETLTNKDDALKYIQGKYLTI